MDKTYSFVSASIYDVIIGTHSMFSKDDVLKSDEIKSTILNYLYRNEVNFSFKTISGGYSYKDDGRSEETTYIITVFNEDEQTVLWAVNKFKMLFEQESIIVVRKNAEIAYL